MPGPRLSSNDLTSSDQFPCVPAGPAQGAKPGRSATAGDTGHVIYRPEQPHKCRLPVGVRPLGVPNLYPRGTVWRCDCGHTWVSQGIGGGGRQPSGGYVAPRLEWKRESWWAARRRDRRNQRAESHGKGPVE